MEVEESVFAEEVKEEEEVKREPRIIESETAECEFCKESLLLEKLD